MPPKKAPGKGANKKQEEKKVKKIVEDKTFGLKNKGKSKKVQQYVSNVQNTAKQAVKGRKFKDEEQRKAEKLAAKKDTLGDELGNLFQAVVSTKQTVVPPGVDPKSVICAFFKAGNCTKGKQCKFSHDLEASRKVSKIDLYTDPRSLDTIESWDQAKLESVVNAKIVKTATPTTIVCKHFLDAIENMKYGWFWECPTGPTCHYRHALPPGYVFKNKKQTEEEKKLRELEEENAPSLYDEIEEERKKLDISKCTPVTPETFAKWKEDRKKKKESEVEEKRKEAEKKDKTSRGLGALSGRDLFRFDPSLFVDDEGAADNDEYEVQDNQEEETKNEDPNNLGQEDEDDGEGDGEGDDNEEDGGEGDEEEAEEENATASSSASASKSAKAGKAVAIDEDLFTADEELPDED